MARSGIWTLAPEGLFPSRPPIFLHLTLYFELFISLEERMVISVAWQNLLHAVFVLPRLNMITWIEQCHVNLFLPKYEQFLEILFSNTFTPSFCSFLFIAAFSSFLLIENIVPSFFSFPLPPCSPSFAPHPYGSISNLNILTSRIGQVPALKVSSLKNKHNKNEHVC